MSVSVPVIQSYVNHSGTENWFFVSTIERESSAPVIPAPRYNETLVWAWDPKTRQRTGEHILASVEGPRGSIQTHIVVCQQIFNGGIEALG